MCTYFAGCLFKWNEKRKSEEIEQVTSITRINSSTLIVNKPSQETCTLPFIRCSYIYCMNNTYKFIVIK